VELFFETGCNNKRILITVYRESPACNMTATGYIKYLWSKGRKQGNNDDIRVQENKKNVLHKLLKTGKF